MEKKTDWRYTVHSVEAQQFQIREDKDTLTVPAVITREGVYDYDGMLVYESAEEIEKATFTAENAWIVEEHPNTVILSDPRMIRGTVKNPVFVEDRIKVDLTFFKDRCSPRYLEDIKTGKAKSVSIGFFWQPQPQKGVFNGEKYDYLKTNILIDHVAVGSWEGKCSYPFCGIGLNVNAVSLKPYPNEHACRLRNPKSLDIVGSGTRKSDGKTYRVIFGKPKGKPDAGSVEQAYRYPIKTWSEAEARRHCQRHDGSFEPATGEKQDEREKLHEEAEAREEKYGIKFREGEGHLTPPKGYPQDEDDYADPVNYKYPLTPKDRARNALARWGQFREEYTQPERNIIYARIVKAALGYDIAVKYNPDLAEARALPETLKKQLVGYESAQDLIVKTAALVKELQT